MHACLLEQAHTYINHLSISSQHQTHYQLINLVWNLRPITMIHLAKVVLAAIVLLMVSGLAMATPSCKNIMNELHPCVPYLSKTEGQPSSSCCNGPKYLAPYFHSKKDRQAICQCLRRGAKFLVDNSVVDSLPKKCKVSITLPHYSHGQVDCSK